MPVVLVIVSILIAMMMGRHYYRAQQARESYRGARAELLGLRRAARSSAVRAAAWTGGLALGVLLLAVAYR